MTTTSAELRERARDCVLWASQTNDTAQAHTLMGVARDWTMAAFIIDRQAIRVETNFQQDSIERAA